MVTSYKDRKAVKRLAQEYGMPESYMRQMLAIEAGVIDGDVTEHRRMSIRWTISKWISILFRGSGDSV